MYELAPFERRTPAPRRRPLYALVSANFISQIGNGITGLAIPWFVLESTGSASRTGLTAFFVFMPMVIAAAFGGALVDRVGNKRISIVADLASAVTVAMVPVLYHSVGLPFWALLALVFAGALLDTPGNTGRQAMLPDLAELGDVPLERANGLSQSGSSLSGLIGPALAGLLVVWLGPSNVLYFDAASFIVSALLVFLFVPSVRTVVRSEERYIDDFRSGLRFLRTDRLLMTIVVVSAFANFFAAPIGSVLLPVFVKDHFGSAGKLGLLISALGAGALAGSLLYGWFGAKVPRRWPFLVAFAMVGVPFFLFAFIGHLLSGIVLMIVAGIALGLIGPLMMTVEAERVPAEMRGRVFGAMMAIGLCASPLGVLVAGPLTQRFGADTMFIVSGASLVMIAAILAFQPPLKEMERSTALNESAQLAPQE